MFESLSDRLGATLDGLRSQGRLSEEDIQKAMREIRLALLEADVNFGVVRDFVAKVRERAMGAEVILPCHRNPPDGDGGPNHWEVWLRDPDGYKVVLASPDGTADGDWRP